MEWGIKNDTNRVFKVFIFDILILKKERKKKLRCLFLWLLTKLTIFSNSQVSFHLLGFWKIINSRKCGNEKFPMKIHWSNCNKTIYIQGQILGILEVKGHKNKGRDDIDNAPK